MEIRYVVYDYLGKEVAIVEGFEEAREMLAEIQKRINRPTLAATGEILAWEYGDEKPRPTGLSDVLELF